MADPDNPKMRALADYLLRSYRKPSAPGEVRVGQVPPESVPLMSSDARRVDAFVRYAQANPPDFGKSTASSALARQKALGRALQQPTGTRSGRGVRESMNPVSD